MSSVTCFWFLADMCTGSVNGINMFVCRDMLRALHVFNLINPLIMVKLTSFIGKIF